MSETRETLGIVGAGRFGTALANAIAENGCDALIWTMNQKVATEINEGHCNESRLPGVSLSPHVYATVVPRELVDRARFIVFALSANQVRSRARILGEFMDGNTILVHAVGTLAGDEAKFVSEVLAEETPALRIGALAGPVFPDDLIHKSYASMVVASHFAEVCSEARRLLGVKRVLRIYQSNDLLGVELSSALSGAYAIAMGLGDAMAIDACSRAVLITRIVAEATRFIEGIGGQRKTFAGLAGLGNLLVRSSPSAVERKRDYSLGLQLGKNNGDIETIETPSVGTYAALRGLQLAEEKGIRLPVLMAIGAILRGKGNAQEVVKVLADSVAAEE